MSHPERVVQVREAPRGKKPKWGGFIPQILSYEVCQKVRHALVSAETYPYLDPTGAAALDERRRDLGDLLRHPGAPLRIDDEGAHWWTFAGGRINHTLRHALELLAGWKVVADNFQLRIEVEEHSNLTIEQALDRLASSVFWTAPETRAALLARLPAYRLSKFQRALPASHSAEMVGEYLLDFAGAQGFCERARPAGRSAGGRG